MFVDEVKIEATGGRGGDGAVSFRREKYVPHGGPDGGDGGDGGCVIFRADDSLHTLQDFRYRSKLKAPDGRPGGTGKRSGAKGDDLIIPVPVGTIVRDNSGQIIADLTESGQEVVAVQGGRGGRGNHRFATARRQAPKLYDKGEPGEYRNVTLELKLIADVAIIGLPNAGKSMFLSTISAARPRVANYPFTTLNPHLGVVTAGESSFVAVDLPGLIEGAHEGVGQGDQFLRHAERSLLLLHLVDVSEMAHVPPEEALMQLREELHMYGTTLAGKPQIIVATKKDLPGASENMEKLRAKIKALKSEEAMEIIDDLWSISAATGEGVEELVFYLAHKTTELRQSYSLQDSTQGMEKEEKEEERRLREKRSKKATSPYTSELVIVKEGNAFRVKGHKLESLVARTDFDNPEALHRFHNACQRLDLDAKLKQQGAQDGDPIRIGNYEFIFEDEEEEFS